MRGQRPTYLLLALVAATALALGACNSKSKTANTPASSAPSAKSPITSTATGADEYASTGGGPSGSLKASDQTSDGKSLKIEEVVLKDAPGGWLTVHSDTNGAPGPVVGYAAVKTGDNDDVVVTFDKPITTGAYWPMLHVDAPKASIYEFPGADIPVQNGAEIVMKKIQVTVQ